MSKHKKKQPGTRFVPGGQKVPGLVPPSADPARMVWSFSRFDPDIPLVAAKPNEYCFVEVSRAIKALEQGGLANIDGHKVRHHLVQVESMAKFARDWLERNNADDIDELFSLSIGARARLWTIRSLNHLSLIWFDPEHEVCPAPKRNT